MVLNVLQNCHSWKNCKCLANSYIGILSLNEQIMIRFKTQIISARVGVPSAVLAFSALYWGYGIWKYTEE